ncbi:AT-hook motif nuclear-localized protein [Salix suchowensis]|nr:AT-hook motif nuclear-localized protein [Salix suchowensis]
MDRRDAMAISGSASFYMHRGITSSDTSLNVSSNLNTLSNTNVAFQPNIGASTMGSTFSMDHPVAISPHGVNVGAPSAMPPSSEPVKRKRGRPRKYGPDGAVSLALSSSLSTHPGTITPTQKRGRGRPPGTGRKQQLASLGEWLSGSAGMGFTPHIITIAVGEDIATKIMSFSQLGPRAICILSANGAVSTVTLRQPGTSGGTVTYEGRFEILCLSGSYLLTNEGGSRNRSGGLSVSLASPDGRVIGGGIGGVLIAASPVQVIVGSFLWGGGSKTKNKKVEAPEGARDPDRQTEENPVTPTSVQPSQNLTPTSSMGVWPGSRSVDMRNTHVDIDLMRG